MITVSATTFKEVVRIGKAGPAAGAGYAGYFP
jgi:hypothetical protein